MVRSRTQNDHAKYFYTMLIANLSCFKVDENQEGKKGLKLFCVLSGVISQLLNNIYSTYIYILQGASLNFITKS